MGYLHASPLRKLNMRSETSCSFLCLQQSLVGGYLAGWVADCCAAAVRLQLTDSGVYLHERDELDVDELDDGFADACFVLAIMTPSGNGASTSQTCTQYAFAVVGCRMYMCLRLSACWCVLHP